MNLDADHGAQSLHKRGGTPRRASSRKPGPLLRPWGGMMKVLRVVSKLCVIALFSFILIIIILGSLFDGSRAELMRARDLANTMYVRKLEAQNTRMLKTLERCVGQ